MKNLLFVTGQSNCKFLFLEKFSNDIEYQDENESVESNGKDKDYLEKTSEQETRKKKKEAINSGMEKLTSTKNIADRISLLSKKDVPKYEAQLAHDMGSIETPEEYEFIIEGFKEGTLTKEETVSFFKKLDSMSIEERGLLFLKKEGIDFNEILNESGELNLDKIKNLLGKEKYSEYINIIDIGNRYNLLTSEKKAILQLDVATGEITQKEAQEQFDKYVQKQIENEPDLKEYYEGIVEKSKSYNKNEQVVENFNELLENVPQNSREKISVAQKSGVNVNSIKGVAIDKDGNTILSLNTIKTIHGTPIKMNVKVDPKTGKTALKTPFFDEYHTFSNTNELKGIIKLAKYNAIISQIIKRNHGNNEELETKLSDNNLEEVVTLFEKINCEGHDRYEVFDKICKNLFNKSTAKQKKEFGHHLHEIFVGKVGGYKKSTGQIKDNIKRLVDEAVNSLSNGQESDLSKDIKLGTGTQVEYNPENS